MTKVVFNRNIKIGNRYVSEEAPVFIIAEAGVNHNGDMELAAKLIDVACQSGADAVKFQTFKADRLILKTIEKAPYQKLTTDSKQNQYEMLKTLEVNQKQNRYLQDYCNKKGILFLSTPFEEDSLDELCGLGISAIKIAATDLTNIQYLRKAAKSGKPIILSAGMCYLEEIRIALECIYPYNKDVILLQCTANYPIDDREANLKVITTLQEEFDILVGFSDHSQGVGASPYAVAMGARVIEKHFTLDKEMEGPDHKASVDPEELKLLINEIRKVEVYLGSPCKIPTCSEQQTRKSLQKCLVAARNIEMGEVFSEMNITAKRTNGEGISALYYDDMIGKAAKHKYAVDDLID